MTPMHWVRVLSPFPLPVHGLKRRRIRSNVNRFDRSLPLPDRIFRLLERLQRLDDFLRSAQRRRFADPFELARLRLLKDRIKARLARLTPIPA